MVLFVGLAVGGLLATSTRGHRRRPHRHAGRSAAPARRLGVVGPRSVGRALPAARRRPTRGPRSRDRRAPRRSRSSPSPRSCLGRPGHGPRPARETTPVNGRGSISPPDTIELRFSEPVEAGLGAVRLLRRGRHRLDVGAVKRSGHAVRVALPKLDDGGYVVTWRVISARRPSRARRVHVPGRAGADQRPTSDLARRLLAASGSSRLTGALHAAAGSARSPGWSCSSVVVVFALGIWPGGHRDHGDAPPARHRLGSRVREHLAGIPLQAAYAVGWVSATRSAARSAT